MLSRSVLAAATGAIALNPTTRCVQIEYSIGIEHASASALLTNSSSSSSDSGVSTAALVKKQTVSHSRAGQALNVATLKVRADGEVYMVWYTR